MKHYPVLQGSPEWLRLRMGKATASEFERIITPAKWEPTKGDTRRRYAIQLLTELILDTPLAQINTATMQHGHEFEPKARAAYELLSGSETQECGFCVNDEHTVGASPDSFVGADGSLEIKCPAKPDIHVGYLMDEDSFVKEYFIQTQGQLYITGRAWTDLVSYFSGLPMVCVRSVPHPEFQPKLAAALKSFCAEFSDLVEKCVANGWLENRPQMTDWISAGDVEMVRSRRKEQPVGDFDLTEEDIQNIMKGTHQA